MKYWILVFLLLGGCAHDRLVKMQPPADLAESVSTTRPVFVAPGDKAASSCLTLQGEDDLRTLVLELMTKYQALRAWAVAK
jgi:hypothetical protein